MVQIITITPDDDGQRLDRFLRNKGMNYVLVQKSLRNGRIRVNKQRKSPDYRLQQGDMIALPAVVTPQKYSPTDAPISKPVSPRPPADFIIKQTDDFLLINKPAGLASQGGSKLQRHLDGMLEHFCDEAGVKPRLTHRLDKQTSGVMLIARSRNSATRAAEAFANKHINKYYLAVISGKTPASEGMIDLPLLRTPQKMLVDEQGDKAQTRYMILSQKGEFALILLMPLTGRTHQLRVHLVNVGAMIVGESKYKRNNSKDKNLYLHAYRLHWHFQGLPQMKKGDDEIDVTAPMPDYFNALMAEKNLHLPAPAKLAQKMKQLTQM